MKPASMLFAILLGVSTSSAQRVLPALDPSEVPRPRAYEMEWANRSEPAPPTLRFDQLAGWSMRVEGGAEAALQPTRAQNVWNRPVARLRYRGSGNAEDKPRIVLTLPSPMELPADSDSADLWVYGNRWDWENPPGTPAVRILLQLRDSAGARQTLEVDRIRWQEWWLVHKRLASAGERPFRLEAIEVSGGHQSEWREIYFDSLRVYREELAPLTFTPRPRRPLTLFAGQSPGANTGAGVLPFPTREETILPVAPSGPFRCEVRKEQSGYALRYRGEDGELTFRFVPERGLSGMTAEFQAAGASSPASAPLRMLNGAELRWSGGARDLALQSARLEEETIVAEFSDQTTLRLRIWQKSLVIDVLNVSGQVTELALGQVTGLEDPRTVWVPYLTFGGGSHPCVLLTGAGTNRLFASLWLDWYRSNGSELFAAESVSTNSARINGGVRYHARTDERRNPLYERLFVTVSPVFEETLPTVPNPVGLHAAEAADRLWQESWGPDHFEQQMARSRKLRAYGIEKLIQCNHEIAWRDGGESFTLRLRAAPGKGGDTALQRYVAHQRQLGWRSGLYSNYTDYAPVNEFWSPDGVQRLSDGSWRTAWPRCYAEKPLKAVEFDALLAPQIKAKYQPDSAYTDVHTAVAPWNYNDYDARVPGAGTFAQTFYAYGELLRNDSRVYGGPIFSEGTYHWLYAGLADGNYALAYDGRPLAKEPLLPVFDLYQIHTRECDIGMGWTANFCDPIPDWRKPENLDRAIDSFLLHTLAYGHIGWLVEEEHGIDRTCRSYYMLQQVQARYGLRRPREIAYWTGSNLVSVSEAIIRELPRLRRQLYVEYEGGLRLWLNDHPTENWQPSEHSTILPPAGWLAQAGQDLVSFSGLSGANRVDYLASPSYTYLDGRGHWFSTDQAGSDGALAVRPVGTNSLEVIHISGREPFQLRRPYGARGVVTQVTTYHVEGRQLSDAPFRDTDSKTRIDLVPNAVRYLVRLTTPP